MEPEKYFEEVVLPSVKMIYKNSYNIRESCVILDCCPRTLRNMVGRGEIFITNHRRIYAQEFRRYFSLCPWPINTETCQKLPESA